MMRWEPLLGPMLAQRMAFWVFVCFALPCCALVGEVIGSAGIEADWEALRSVAVV